MYPNKISDSCYHYTTLTHQHTILIKCILTFFSHEKVETRRRDGDHFGPDRRQGREKEGGHPAGQPLHPTPYTLHPTPYTLHPTPYIPHPTHPTRHPTPFTYTLHPRYYLHLTYTLNSTPCTLQSLHVATCLDRVEFYLTQCTNSMVLEYQIPNKTDNLLF